jgi:tetratricopeptide (TPR) repeat protein
MAHRLVDRGRTYLDWQKWDDADAAFTRAIELRPEYAEPWEARSDLYTRLGLFDLAVRDFNRAYEFQQPVNWRWMALALLRLNAGDVAGWRDASVRIRQQTHATSVREFDVDAVRAAVLRTDPEVDPRAPVDIAQGLVDAEPGSPFLRYLLGLAHYRAEEFEKAATQLHAALSLPGWTAQRMALPGLAMASYRLGRDADARSTLDDAAKSIDEWTEQICRTDDNWAVHQGVGVWPIPWWDWLECRLFYHEARLLIDGAAPPEDPRLHLIRARAFSGLRRTAQATEEYDAALAGLPDNPQVQFERFRTRGYYFSYRDWPRAAHEFAEARRIAPDQAPVWNFEAIARLAAGDLAAYQQLCAAMLDRFRETENPNCANNILCACVLRPDGVSDPAQLVPLARVAARLYHGNLIVIGAACYRAGEYEEAVRVFDDAARRKPARAWESCFNAMAHHHLGHADRARRCLQSAADWIAKADQPDSIGFEDREHAWGGLTERFEFSLLYAEASDLIAGARSGNALPSRR